MRYWYFSTFVVAVLAGALPFGCAPGATQSDGGSMIDAIVGASDNTGATATGDAPTGDTETPASVVPTQSRIQEAHLSGALGGSGDYQLFDLGDGRYGDKWTITSDAASSGSYLVVLFDANDDLLYRQLVTTRAPFVHTLRRDTNVVRAGVTPAYGSKGGTFNFQAALSGASVPAAQPQVVWVNFGPGSDVHVHQREGISFPAFDAGTLGTAYVGHTDDMKAAIIDAMLDDYAPYNVIIMTSDDGPPPSAPFATLHIGGDDNRLLGLADNVDQYNTNRGQTAVIYVESFADFAVMRLDPGEMAQMIGNTASHELGHLLGLYHTKTVEDLMDTTGTAWDLVANQSFIRGDLEPSVFPFGYENCPERLADAVGWNPDESAQTVTKSVDRAKMLRKAELRSMMQHELRCRCGNCLNPDG